MARPDRGSPRLTMVALALIACACNRDDVRFEMRGFQTKSNETEYSTNFTREGTVVVLGNSPSTQDPYGVLFEVKHLSGGDPDLVSREPDPHYEFVFVNKGAGDYLEYAGSRAKKTSFREADTWEQEKVDVKPIGFIHFKKIP